METNFTTLDICIVIVFLIVSLATGLIGKNYVSSIKNFLGAGQAINTSLGVATLAGTEMGLVTVMYSAEKGFTGGFAAFHIGLVAGFVTLLIGLSGFIVSKLRSYNVLTIPEYYEKRYNKNTRVLGGLILVLGGVLNMGLFLKAGAIFLVGVTGLSPGSWQVSMVMFGLLLLVLIYTIFGGMVSIVITDYIQFVVLSLGLVISVILAANMLGWDNIVSTLYAAKGEAAFNPLLSESSFGLSYIIWMAITAGLVSCAIWPTAVSRALAAKNASIVKKQFSLSSLAFTVRFLLPNFLGLCAWVYLSNHAEYKSLFHFDGSTGQLSNLYAMPLFLAKLLPSGLLGLMTASMLAAFMSTHDSYLLVWSSVITRDIIEPLRKKKFGDKSTILITRIIIIIIGFYIFYWGIFYKGSEQIWDYMAITGAIYFTGAIIVLIAGIYWKRASSSGAMAALITGLSALVGLGPIKKALGFSSIDGSVIGLTTIVISAISMIIFSYALPDKRKEQPLKEAN